MKIKDVRINAKYKVKRVTDTMLGFEIGDIVMVTDTNIRGRYRIEIESTQFNVGYCNGSCIEKI